MNKRYNVYYEKLNIWKSPKDLFFSLFSQQKHAFWLDSSMVKKDLSRFSYIGTTNDIISYSINNTSPDIFSLLEKKLKIIRVEKTKLPFDFVGGYVGYFGYELKKFCGGQNPHTSKYPDSIWYFVNKFLVFDHKEKAIYLVFLSNRNKNVDIWFKKMKNTLQTIHDSSKPSILPKKNDELIFQLATNKKNYLQNIKKCKEYLTNGESYETCLTNMIGTDINIDPLVLYMALREVNPAPYAAYIRNDDLSILCSSPERFLKINQKKLVESKPIKGTIKRSKNKKKDRMLAGDLQQSEKERAENLMIVDLLRNDLGKVCKVGSVSVPHLMKIESYSGVHQLVSTIKGRLRKNATVIECIKACFPGGSMTGAPKIRTMEIIDKLEANPRGIYSGSLGYLSANGAIDLNIVIRTIIAENNSLSIGTGGAITVQSDPGKEYSEIMLKAKPLMLAVAKTIGAKKYHIKSANRLYNTAMHTIFLALGSNVGDRKKFINDAIKQLDKKIKQIALAKLYETEPMHYKDQNKFLNTVLRGVTNLSPIELLEFVKKIEKDAGRIKRFRNGPREIDIDILFYDDLIFSSSDLQIPHPRIQERNFVLKPLANLDPDFIHPVDKKTVKQLLKELGS